MTNTMTAPNHRGEAISRHNPDSLTRMTEDHGVCLSSCLDGWEDDLVLHAFARNLIVSPELYGNPWLLRDDEYSYLAYIFNLARDYGDILPSGMFLPESYGPDAVSRGDASTRFLALRNLSWKSVKYTIRLDTEIGLSQAGKVKARLYHPYILDMGEHAYGSTLEVEVLPFRSVLLKVTTSPEKDRVALSGVPYRIVNDRIGNTLEVKLLGEGSSSARLRIETPSAFSGASLDGTRKGTLLSGRSLKVDFSGPSYRNPWHRRLAVLEKDDAIAPDAESIYWATVFAADNNPLEVRSLYRSGPTSIPEVQAARDAFFGQSTFVGRELWDKALFDGDPGTAFSFSLRNWSLRTGNESSFCLDLGSAQEIDTLVMDSFDEYSIQPLRKDEGTRAMVSVDLVSWKEVTFLAGAHMEVDLSSAGPVRYIRFSPAPHRLCEVYALKDGVKLPREGWRASNLFASFGRGAARVKASWSGSFTLDELPRGAYLCIAVEGNSGKDGAWAGVRIDGEYVGCPDRAPSFVCNSWEGLNTGNGNYTYYLPLTEDMLGKRIEAVVLSLEGDSRGTSDLHPEVWITCGDLPLSSRTLTLTRK